MSAGKGSTLPCRRTRMVLPGSAAIWTPTQFAAAASATAAMVLSVSVMKSLRTKSPSKFEMRGKSATAVPLRRLASHAVLR